jgi:peptidoglycan/xylan/chitin deacetylase (PgdA/CDA1 family)
MWATSRFSGLLQRLYGSYCADGFGVLMYHRIAAPVPGIRRPTANVTPDRFREQLTGLLSMGFSAWPLSKLLHAHRNGEAIPANAFAVTFDDGFENNYTDAWPVLKELNVPATILLATNYLDSDRPFPFDAWSGAGTECVPESTWRPLSTGQCAEMLDSGLVELGAHTHTHGKFVGHRNAFRQDLARCLNVLRGRFQLERPAFAFPYGAYSAELVDVAMELGVSCCLTTRHQRVNPGAETTLIGRFNVECSDSPAVVAGKLSGWRTAIAETGKRSIRPFARRTRISDRCQADSTSDVARWDGIGTRKAASR